MRSGEWGDEGDEGAGEEELLLFTHAQCPMPHAPCPIRHLLAVYYRLMCNCCDR
ncbi:hypothetical protein [Nostoc favosum]|uniref:Uncharacterized protein n=1 Tax=Nostoc favosum CHAB5714 TaxID=2780399 RepID=A0ABS8IB86_9NOSO|nr:hypothetical protein [Nostoc favosum]MCC5601465.1 hypothetical protein [Nostoc favosum CHAB5714]